jgi:uncharacterized protein YndB with AHSA1/START domain
VFPGFERTLALMATKPTLVFTYELHSDPQRVFDVLTQPKHLNKYYTKDVHIDLQVGGKYSNADGEAGKFVKVAVPRQLVFTYTHSRLGFDTEVDIWLEPSRPLGWTRFRLVHKGLDPQKINPETHAWMTARWQFLASALKGYLGRESAQSFANWQTLQKPVYEQRP